MDPLVPLERSICKAARALLDWSAEELAKVAGISIDTLRSFESGRTRAMSRENERAVRTAFSGAGIQLLDDGDRAGGVGVAKSVAIHSGSDGVTE